MAVCRLSGRTCSLLLWSLPRARRAGEWLAIGFLESLYFFSGRRLAIAAGTGEGFVFRAGGPPEPPPAASEGRAFPVHVGIKMIVSDNAPFSAITCSDEPRPLNIVLAERNSPSVHLNGNTSARTGVCVRMVNSDLA